MEKTNLTLEEINEQIKKLEEAREEIKKAEQEKLLKEKEARKKEVNDAYKRYVELRNEFSDDYGYYVYNTTNKDEVNSLLKYFL